MSVFRRKFVVGRQQTTIALLAVDGRETSESARLTRQHRTGSTSALRPRSGILVVLGLVAMMCAAHPAAGILCASDPVPAATLLFPFVTGKYDPSSTPTDPVTDPDAATTLFAVTNVSSNSKIVHFVLWNDLSFPVLDWDVLLTGYDVITYSMENILAGHLQPTGPDSSPTGATPIGRGPAPSFQVGVPVVLPAPDSTAARWSACTDPSQTTPFPVDTESQVDRLPTFSRQFIFDGMMYSQNTAMDGDVPPWLSEWRSSAAGQVNGYVTADVVAACGFDGPEAGQPYFDRFAVPKTEAFYGNDPGNASGPTVSLGNTLLGDWFVRNKASNSAQGGAAVHIEVDNMDVANSRYGKSVADGASFYRYAGASAGDFPATDAHYVTGPVGGEDDPIIDRREPLPSSFAFRWLVGGEFDGGTTVRVWKETPDINSNPTTGSVTVIGNRQYTYWAWDEEERLVYIPPPGCDVTCPEPDLPIQMNQFPLVIQEVAVSPLNFELPVDANGDGFGWMLLSFPGSNGDLLDDIADGYLSPDPNTHGTQAWVEVSHDALDRFSVGLPAGIMGNYLCDGLPNLSGATTGAGVDGRTDLGNWLY